MQDWELATAQGQWKKQNNCTQNNITYLTGDPNVFSCYFIYSSFRHNITVTSHHSTSTTVKWVFFFINTVYALCLIKKMHAFKKKKAPLQREKRKETWQTSTVVWYRRTVRFISCCCRWFVWFLRLFHPRKSTERFASVLGRPMRTRGGLSK